MKFKVVASDAMKPDEIMAVSSMRFCPGGDIPCPRCLGLGMGNVQCTLCLGAGTVGIPKEQPGIVKLKGVGP